MKILFATKNPAKIGKYKAAISKHGIELLTISDLGFELNIDESGADSLENAYIKAKTYFDATSIPTIGMDNSLFIDGLDTSAEPNTHVRRVNGKYLTDSEMINYYSNLIHQHGGKLSAKWNYGMVFYSENGAKYFSWTKGDFYLVDAPSKVIHEGYPLDSLSIIPEFNKYLTELSPDERESYKNNDDVDEVVNFILKALSNK